MAEIKRLLCSATARLVILTGAGGCGKTRFALQVAADLLDSFPDGVGLIELAPLAHPALVPQALASVFDVRETPDCPLDRALVDYFRTKNLLLVLDNCEHLLDACARLSHALLRACPHLRILATSLESLGILGETTWRMPSLTMPDVGALSQPGMDPVAALTQSEAARLFVDRALAALPSFRLTEQNVAAVAQICHRLDGMPLALELTAARVKALSVEQIAAHLDDCFQLLTAGNRTALPRHQTLHATIDWSYNLLTEEECVLFRRLAVFAGGWTLEAAEQVTRGQSDATQPSSPVTLDALAHLVDKSLVVAGEESGQTRYRMLEMIRQYAREKLIEAGEEQAVRQQHFDFFIKLIQETVPGLARTDQTGVLIRLEQEHDNVRASLQWTIQREQIEAGLRLAGVLGDFWYMHGHLREGRDWLEKLLAHAGSDARVDLGVRGKALHGLTFLNYRQGDLAQARQRAEQELIIWRQTGHKEGIAVALNDLGLVTQELGDYMQAEAFYTESLAIWRELGQRYNVGIGLNNLGWLMQQRGDNARAIPLLEESLILHRENGDEYRMAYPLCNLGDIARRQAEYTRAESLYQQCLAVCRKLEHTWGIARLLGRLGDTALGQGDAPRATQLQIESLRLRQTLADKEGIVCCLEGLARVAGAQNQPLRAVRLFGAAEVSRETIHAPLPPADRAEYDHNVTAIRAQLDQPVFAAAWVEGRAMTLEQAVAYALTETPAFPMVKQETVQVKAEPELRIFALGSPRVCRGERELAASDWKYAKTREMFFYLLCHPSRTKEQIGVVLWQDASDAQLRSNFRVAMYHLRHALGRSEWILFENEQYTFNRALPFWFDVDAFEQAIADARGARADDPPSAIRHLQSAIDLYRGEFLEGVNGEWFCQRQQELQRGYLDALLMLGQFHFAQAQYSAAADAYRKAIAADSFLEAAHRELMRCYARLGERGQALRHYQELVELLRDEMGAAPAPETQALFEQARQGKEV